MFSSVLVAFTVALGDLEWTQMRILFSHYAKYIWATSMPVAIMNVPTFAENLVRKYISFLLRSIPLTTKLWFKIHNHLKSPTSLNRIVWSSDEKTFGYSWTTLFTFIPFVRFFSFLKIKSTANKGRETLLPQRPALEGKRDLQPVLKSHSSRCSLSHTSTPVCLGIHPYPHQLSSGPPCLPQCSFITRVLASFLWLTSKVGYKLQFRMLCN